MQLQTYIVYMAPCSIDSYNCRFGSGVFRSLLTADYPSIRNQAVDLVAKSPLEMAVERACHVGVAPTNRREIDLLVPEGHQGGSLERHQVGQFAVKLLAGPSWRCPGTGSPFIAAHVFRTDQNEVNDLLGSRAYRDETDATVVIGEVTFKPTDALSLIYVWRCAEERRTSAARVHPAASLMKT